MRKKNKKPVKFCFASPSKCQMCKGSASLVPAKSPKIVPKQFHSDDGTPKTSKVLDNTRSLSKGGSNEIASSPVSSISLPFILPCKKIIYHSGFLNKFFKIGFAAE